MSSGLWARAWTIGLAATALTALTACNSSVGDGSAPAGTPSIDYDLVTLSGEARQEITNDWMSALLAFELRDPDPARLGRVMNRKIEQALAGARAYSHVRFQSRNYQTVPEVDKDGAFIGWRAQAQFSLEGADFEKNGALIGALQAEGMVVQRVDFTVSPDRRREAEEALTQSAIAAFRHRAEVVQQALDASGFRIVEMNLDDIRNGGGQLAESRMMMLSKQSAVPLASESGVTELVVRVNGRIQLTAD